jgi:uncharacterized phiE125 gp8 family phage protein
MQSTYLASYQQSKFVNESDSFKYKRIGTLPVLPITAQDMQNQIRVDVLLEQASYLNLIIASAIRYAEEYMNLSLINTQWQTTRDNFDANAFELRKGYFVSLEKFQYIDVTTGLYVTVDPTIYQIADKSYYAQILLLQGYQFPFNNIKQEDNAINIEFTAGMSANPSDFLAQYPDLKMALLQHCTFIYENRGNDTASMMKDTTSVLPQMILDVYDRYKAPSIFSGTIFNGW